MERYPKLCGNCAFPQNIHTRKLGGITEFFAVSHTYLHKAIILHYNLAYTAIDEIAAALRNNDVKGALIESFVAAEYQPQLSGFRLQTIIEHVSSYGIVFQNKGTRFSKCIREYVFSRQGAIFDIISNSITPIKVGF